MKRIAGVLMIAVASFFAPACNESKTDGKVDEKKEISIIEVPVAVKDSFAATHSGATDIVWEEAHEGNADTYKVKFRMNDKKMKAEYNKDGTLVKEGDD